MTCLKKEYFLKSESMNIEGSNELNLDLSKMAMEEETGKGAGASPIEKILICCRYMMSSRFTNCQAYTLQILTTLVEIMGKSLIDVDGH
jgi:hypothetical protein